MIICVESSDTPKTRKISWEARQSLNLCPYVARMRICPSDRNISEQKELVLHIFFISAVISALPVSGIGNIIITSMT